MVLGGSNALQRYLSQLSSTPCGVLECVKCHAMASALYLLTTRRARLSQAVARAAHILALSLWLHRSPHRDVSKDQILDRHLRQTREAVRVVGSMGTMDVLKPNIAQTWRGGGVGLITSGADPNVDALACVIQHNVVVRYVLNHPTTPTLCLDVDPRGLMQDGQVLECHIDDAA
eukprot:COSAG02_NODE_10129_length_2014_cov_7.665405_3_plen_174_part_00